MKVKGTLLIDAVKMIRKNPSLEWDKWLTQEDWDIVRSRILPAAWYPWETFKRVFIATFKLIGNSDFATARFFGRYVLSKNLSIYRHILCPEDPVLSVERLTTLRRAFFSDDLGMSIKVEDHGDGWIKYQAITTPDEADREIIEAEGNFLAGLAEEVIEKCGKRVVETNVEVREYGCEVLLKWECQNSVTDSPFDEASIDTIQ